MSNVCGHGSLVRKCEVCERDEEIAELKAEVERLTEVNEFLVESLKAALGIEIEIEDDTDE